MLPPGHTDAGKGDPSETKIPKTPKEKFSRNRRKRKTGFELIKF